MWAWTSTPVMTPRGVAAISRLAAKVAPTSTILSRNGLSRAAIAFWAPSWKTGSLGMVRKLPGGPMKLILQSSSWVKRSGVAGAKLPPCLIPLGEGEFNWFRPCQRPAEGCGVHLAQMRQHAEGQRGGEPAIGKREGEREATEELIFVSRHLRVPRGHLKRRIVEGSQTIPGFPRGEALRDKGACHHHWAGWVAGLSQERRSKGPVVRGYRGAVEVHVQPDEVRPALAQTADDRGEVVPRQRLLLIQSKEGGIVNRDQDDLGGAGLVPEPEIEVHGLPLVAREIPERRHGGHCDARHVPQDQSQQEAGDPRAERREPE
jgi:hypothetical protein